MKKILFLSAALVSFSSFASTVKVTSFVYPRSGQYYAELCGQVSDSATSPTFVQITVDPRMKKSGMYNTVADSSGKFCIAVVTYSGEAELKVFDETEKTFTKTRK